MASKSVPDCCDKTVPFNFQLLTHPRRRAVWNGFGPSSFYCHSHRMRTRVHQVCTAHPPPSMNPAKHKAPCRFVRLCGQLNA